MPKLIAAAMVILLGFPISSFALPAAEIAEILEIAVADVREFGYKPLFLQAGKVPVLRVESQKGDMKAYPLGGMINEYEKGKE